MSGYCLTMNPWRAPAQPAPAELTKHGADLDAAEAAEAPPVQNAAASARSVGNNRR